MSDKLAAPSVGRLLDLFELFRERGRPLSLTALARHLGIPKSSCHNIVKALISRGYLYSQGQPQLLYPTPRMGSVAGDITRKDPFVARTHELLERLRDISGETVILGKRQGDSVIYLEVVLGAQAVRYSAESGDIKPLHSSAIGKAMLGSLKPAELIATCERLPLPQITSSTVVSPAMLIDDVRKGQQLGFYVTSGENVTDVWGIASPLHAPDDRLAIAIAGPQYRMEKDTAKYGRLVMSTSHLISRSLEYG